jgi:hypothetical protein
LRQSLVLSTSRRLFESRWRNLRPKWIIGIPVGRRPLAVPSANSGQDLFCGTHSYNRRMHTVNSHAATLICGSPCIPTDPAHGRFRALAIAACRSARGRGGLPCNRPFPTIAHQLGFRAALALWPAPTRTCSGLPARQAIRGYEFDRRVPASSSFNRSATSSQAPSGVAQAAAGSDLQLRGRSALFARMRELDRSEPHGEETGHGAAAVSRVSP